MKRLAARDHALVLHVKDGFKAERRSLHIPEGTSFEDCMRLGHQLVGMHDASLFWIGDWINHMKSKYGEKYKKALEILPYEYQSLVNIAYTCAHMPPERRHEELTFTHHREVQSLPKKKQDAYLRRAAKEKMSVMALRAAVRLGESEYGRERAAEEGGRVFNVVRWSQEGVRWFERELKRAPLSSWPADRRRLLKQDLAALVALYQQL